MINYIRIYFENLHGDSKVVAYISGLWGWFCGLFLLDAGPVWVYLIKSFGGLCFGLTGVVLGVYFTDYYKINLKHKLFKNGNNKKEESGEGDQKEDRA